MKTVLTLALIASLATVSVAEAKGRPRRSKDSSGDPNLSTGAMKGGAAALGAGSMKGGSAATLGGMPAPRAARGRGRAAGAVASSGGYSTLGETTLLPGAGGGSRPARKPKGSPY